MAGDIDARIDAALDRRAAVDAATAEAGRLGVDPGQLLDSQTFYDRLGQLSPRTPDFAGQVAALVAERAADLGHPAAPEPQTGDEQAGPRQWTDADLQGASWQDISAAMKAGQMTDLGFGTGPRTAPPGDRQWTMQDVKNATPRETSAAMKAGLLADLGIGQRPAGSPA